MSLLWATAANPTGPFHHWSDHEHQPGDIIEGPAARGGTSPHNWGHDAYSPHHVYLLHHPHYHLDINMQQRTYGDHLYEVEPMGHVEHDPEDQPGEDGYSELAHSYRAPKARVVRKVPEHEFDHLWNERYP